MRSNRPPLSHFSQFRFYLSLPPHNFFYIFLDRSFHFSLPPGPIPHRYQYFTRRRRLSLSLHQLLPPHLVRARSDRPPGRRPHLPASTSCLLFSPLMGSPRSSSRKPLSDLPCPVAPPLPSLTLRNQVPVSPRVFPYGGTFLSLPASNIHTPTPPPCRPRLAAQSPAGPGWWRCVLCLHVPCGTTSPSLCSTPSLGVV